MHNMKWRIRSLLNNLRKKKYKALLRYFYDSKYRADINYMLKLVRAQQVKCVEGVLNIGDIVQGHDVNYYEWLKELRIQIHRRGYLSLEPVKVIYDKSRAKFLIVDGNHRFIALKKELSPFHKIPVKILIPIGDSNESF